MGCANHSAYAINVTDPKKRPVELYNKRNGHTGENKSLFTIASLYFHGTYIHITIPIDWVSGVAHLADGRIITVGMDSKLCLWSANKRQAQEIHAHNGSISKIASATRYNLAVTCGYDRKINFWKFPTASGRATSLSGPVMVFLSVCVCACMCVYVCECVCECV